MLPAAPVQPAVEVRTESALNSPAPGVAGTGAGEIGAGGAEAEVEQTVKEEVGVHGTEQSIMEPEGAEAVGAAKGEVGADVHAAGELDFFVDNLPPILPTEEGMDLS